MDQDVLDKVLRKLIRLTGEVSKGKYDNASEIFEYTKPGRYPSLVADLAESFGMMIVQVEARDRLGQIIEDLNEKNIELENTLNKVRLLEKIQSHLNKFVPDSVRQIIEKAPEDPDLEKKSEMYPFSSGTWPATPA